MQEFDPRWDASLQAAWIAEARAVLARWDASALVSPPSAVPDTDDELPEYTPTGAELRARRVAFGLTQQDCATVTHYSRRYIGSMEQDQSGARIDQARLEVWYCLLNETERCAVPACPRRAPADHLPLLPICRTHWAAIHERTRQAVWRHHASAIAHEFAPADYLPYRSAVQRALQSLGVERRR